MPEAYVFGSMVHDTQFSAQSKVSDSQTFSLALRQDKQMQG